MSPRKASTILWISSSNNIYFVWIVYLSFLLSDVTGICFITKSNYFIICWFQFAALCESLVTWFCNKFVEINIMLHIQYYVDSSLFLLSNLQTCCSIQYQPLEAITVQVFNKRPRPLDHTYSPPITGCLLGTGAVWSTSFVHCSYFGYIFSPECTALWCFLETSFK